MSEVEPACMCPKLEVAVNILGKKWNGAIIYHLINHPQRFCQLRDSIEGISDRVLIERLRELSKQGLVAKCDEQGNYQAKGNCYGLTSMGQAMEPVLADLHTWAQDWVCLDKAQENVS
ncbi:hypothetical protein AWM75_02340 [Aerococcus urinaehominis]|uniref:Uncharacterized protein n=1 Tax=Aerococcus urinaehominis TaxID=128944 RepID=A0A109RGM1_9LACT|nr:helix-turn-helix domain-containing protein [Aerococcus urinaehominis]AMB98901.1 hypothetical protein AWM75_02340 [Aerococcus urinaehominis]SDM60910.1 transcriptional regulator, HxlR family [Aerococcus urinaehominis]